MSELIDNRRKRQEQLKAIIRDLHAGADLEEIKQRFKELLGEVVSPSEISEMEQALINEGMPVEEIRHFAMSTWLYSGKHWTTSSTPQLKSRLPIPEPRFIRFKSLKRKTRQYPG